jgi:hypothetical protein
VHAPNLLLPVGGAVVRFIHAETSRSALILVVLSFLLAVVFLVFQQTSFAVMMALIGAGGVIRHLLLASARR